MTDQTDPTLDRLLCHMAWANASLLAIVAAQPDEALALAAPRNEWSVAMIVGHLVGAAEGYVRRLDGGTREPDPPPPATRADVLALAARCAAADARLRALGAVPEGSVVSGTPPRTRARSTILAQAIHHATEHRAQIAAALATNGNDAIDLDELDLWAYGDAEGLGA